MSSSSSESEGDDAAFEGIRCYFRKREWAELSSYEKTSLSASKRNYEAMLRAGLEPKMPKFMRPEEKAPTLASKSKQAKRPVKPRAAPAEHAAHVTAGPSRASRRIRTKYNYDEDAGKENVGGSQDEDVLFCDECNKPWMGDCPQHGQLNCISDVKVAADDPDRDTRSAPWPVAVLPRPAGPAEGETDEDVDDELAAERWKTGVWAKVALPRRTRFGPYEGDIMPIARDGDPPNLPNWMHHVRVRQRGDAVEPNLRPFEYAGRLYFRTLVDVAPGTELIVTFKPQPVSGADSPRVNCEHCGRCFECPLLRGQHQRSSAHCSARIQRRRRALVEVQRAKRRTQLEDSPGSPAGRRGGPGPGSDAAVLHRFRKQMHQEWRKCRDEDAAPTAPTGPYPCLQCGQQFSRTVRLHAHMQAAHPFDAGVCDCPDCVGKTPCVLESAVFVCSTCGASFPHSNDLRKHVLLTHLSVKRFECDSCGDSFGRKTVLLDHVRAKH